MKVLHSGALNVKSGGPALSMYLSIRGLERCGVEVKALCPPVGSGDKIIAEDIDTTFTGPQRLGTFAYVPGIRKSIGECGDMDLYHIQGMWMYHGMAVARYARKRKIPYVVTLRGMLYPQALAHNPLIKKLSLMLYQGSVLKNAAAVQCTCQEEMEHYRKLGYKNPVAVIPNPIETKDIADEPIAEKPVFRIGYLGRVHPRKRIERLIYAMDNLRDSLPSDSELLIIGGGDDNYMTFLKEETARLHLCNVKFAGFLSGLEKHEAIKSLSLLVVPSDFENFGNIVTEALVRGVPVAASKGMPWQELVEHDCGWWIDNDQQSIDRTILEAFDKGSRRLREMGGNGRKLMVENYSVEALGRKMARLYRWLLEGGEKPEFVFL